MELRRNHESDHYGASMAEDAAETLKDTIRVDTNELRGRVAAAVRASVEESAKDSWHKPNRALHAQPRHNQFHRRLESLAQPPGALLPLDVSQHRNSSGGRAAAYSPSQIHEEPKKAPAMCGAPVFK